ncbi:MAG: response regulator [Sphingobacteriales bacterium]|nr:response regulator [Sphingobacteriales bacterium]
MILRLFFIVACFGLPQTSLSQAPKLKFRHLSIEQGLSNSTIETIFQDSRGFIWIGTRDGLNRYDGNHFTVYRWNASDSNSISDNYIRYIYEDRRKNLWIGTLNGLNRFNTKKNNFSRFKNDLKNPESLSNNQITSVYEDKKGNLWVGTFGGGLNKFDYQNHSFTKYRHTDKLQTLSNDRVNAIAEDKKGNLWLATDNGLNYFDPQSRRFIAFKFSNSKVVRAIQEDQKGNLWLATEQEGLYLFDITTKQFKHFEHSERNPTSLASNMIKTIMVDKQGNLWVGSINGGLDLFNPESNNFYHYQNEPENPGSLSQRTISALFQDKQENLWVGTHRGGLNLYTPGAEKFKLYQQETNTNSLIYNDVRAFCEDRYGMIWIATDGGGLDMFDRKANRFVHHRFDPFNAQSVGANAVLDVEEDKQGNLWVGTWGGGLNLYNRESKTFTRFLTDTRDKNAISSNHIQKTFEDSFGNLWIATYYGGLNLLDRKTKQFRRIIEATDKKTRLKGNNIVSINEDAQRNIWLGTDDGGLNCYDPIKKRFTHYFDKEDKTPDLRVIFSDSKGRLWVGQTGLYLFDKKADKFVLFTDKAGLSNEFIKGILEDERGILWISTSNGLTELNTKTLQYKKYNRGDGLQGQEFEANACLKSKTGELFFGGINGFNVFYPKINLNKFIPPVYITGFQIFNEQANINDQNSPLKEDISLTKNLSLTYKQSTFSFNFAALNYTVSENNKFAYKLASFDKDWVQAGTENKATYTNLSPGDYTFKVRASNNDGFWNEAGASLQISISPPFYDSWWFRTMVILSMMCGGYLYLQFKRQQELKDLEEKKKEEIHQLQLQFFTNISHEFRTPLSLIMGPLEKLLKENPGTSLQNYYQGMYRNTRRLMSLINELMDFRKVEAGALKLRVMPGNLAAFLHEISDQFNELAEQKQIDFKVDISLLNQVWFDRQLLEKIISNLLNNSFKYTANTGSISVNVFETIEEFSPSFENEYLLKNDYRAKNYVYIRVADNGIGISKESIRHLFERYYRITESHMGSGVGLAFVKSLVMLHKGDIFVYSERHQGTEIIIALPFGEENYTDNERWIQTTEGGIQLESLTSKYEYYTPPESVNQAAQTPLTNAQHILVVDDNEELRKFIKDSLSPFYSISEAADGLAGIEKAKEISPDLIISDVMMPGMNGIDFCKVVKQDIEISHIPFMMLTAKDAIESRIEGVESGADFYFSKPFSIDLLLLTIRNIFEQRTKMKDRYSKDHHVQARELVHSTQDKEFMDKILNIVDKQLVNPEMDIDFLCSEIGMSRTKLYQKIKGITGQSIGDFVRTIRLKTAVHIMSHEDVPLSEVMSRIGIQTQSYFTKAFKKEFGKTPSVFLQEMKKKG